VDRLNVSVDDLAQGLDVEGFFLAAGRCHQGERVAAWNWKVIHGRGDLYILHGERRDT